MADILSQTSDPKWLVRRRSDGDMLHAPACLPRAVPEELNVTNPGWWRR